uniref:Uncharacterized protein n=1 Tax=Monopterus albus TaxID=43700 RepID=A0A3Q3Q4P5_MONAL
NPVVRKVHDLIFSLPYLLCSLYLFSCTIQGNIFINYFLNTGFLVSICRREFHHIPQFCIAIKIKFVVIVVTLSGFHFGFKCEGGRDKLPCQHASTAFTGAGATTARVCLCG